MAIETLLGFRNLDSTENINARLAGLVPKGIIKGGIVTAEPAALQVRVKGTAGEPWVFLAISSEGLIIRERSEEYVLPVVAGTINVICLRAKYLPNAPAVASLEVLALGDYENDPDRDTALIRLASVTPPALAINVSPEDIDLTFRDSIEGFTRRILREVVSTKEDLPAVSGFPATGEINFLANNFALNSSVSVSTGAITDVFQIVPPITFLLANPTTPGLSRLNPSERAIVSAIETPLTGIVTVTTSTAHGLVAGNQIRVQNNTFSQFNGVWSVATVGPAPTQFTFIKAPSPITNMGTSGTVVNTAAIATVTVTLAPGVTHDLVVSLPIVIQNAVDPTFNVTSSVFSVINAQKFTYQMTGFAGTDSGGGTVTKVGFSLPVNSVQIGQTQSVTATNFAAVFNASDLGPIIKATPIGSSLQLETINVGSLGNAYTLTKTEPGVLPANAIIVLSGPTFEGGVDPIPSFQSAVDLRAGDLYVVLFGDVGTMEIWGYDGIIFRNLTSASTITLLDFHRRNLFTNEKHLTENEKSALVGTVGTPSATNPFVTKEDTSTLTQSLAAALQGADDVAPDGSNRFLTEARYRGERGAVSVPANQDYVQLPSSERWVVGNDVGSAIQFFNVVFTSTLTSAGGPIEYTQGDFTPITSAQFYVQAPTSVTLGVSTFNPADLLNPADALVGADALGIYPRTDANALGHPIDLYVKLSGIPTNGTCTVLYARAAKEKTRITPSDMLMGPQRITPAALADVANRASELRFNTGVAVSGTTLTFPANLFVSSNLQNFTFRRSVGTRLLTETNTFSVNLSTGTGTGGIVNSFTPVTFPSANTFTKYLLGLTPQGKVNVYHIGNYLELSGDSAYDVSSLSAVSVPSLPFTQGEWIFASIGVESDGTNTGIQNLVSTSIELYPYQAANSRGTGAEILCGDGTTSFGHFSGTDAHIRALKVAQVGDTIRLLPGTYLGQWLINKDQINVEFSQGAQLQHVLSMTSLALAPAAFSTVTGTITAASHGLSNGHTVGVSSTGVLPGLLFSSVTYYVVGVTTNTFKLSLTPGGSAIIFTTIGSGTHTVATTKTCLNVNAAKFSAYRPRFLGGDIGVNLTVNATEAKVVDPIFEVALVKHFTAASTLTRPNLVFRYSNVATWTCTDGTGSFYGDFNGANALNDAHSAASAGDTILVYPGTYSRVTNFTKSQIQVRGVGPNKVLIDGAGSNPSIIVTGTSNTFENLTCTNSSIGVDCQAGALLNTFSSTVQFTSTAIIPFRFPPTTGTKHGNFHPLFSASNMVVSAGAVGKSNVVVTCGDGAQSWGEYVGIDAINQALLFEQPGTTIKVGKGNYAPINVVSMTNMRLEGSGDNCVIQAQQSNSDAQCVLVVGNGNLVRGFHLEAVNNNLTDYNILGVNLNGFDNTVQDITFTESGTNLIESHRRYSVISGSRNRFVPHTGSPTGYVSWTVGDGRRSFGDFNGLNGIVSALGGLTTSPRGISGEVSGAAGNTCTFTVNPEQPDPLGHPLVFVTPFEFINTTSSFYIDALYRYFAIESGLNIGSFKVTAILTGTSVTLTRTDGGSFTNDSNIIFSLKCGAKIWVLPGTYSPFILFSSMNDIDLEAWGNGNDVIVQGGTPGALVNGNRNRVAGFRFENPAGGSLGIHVVGKDNMFERNIFHTATRYQIDSTASGNQVLDTVENFARNAYTVSVLPSRGDFVGPDQTGIQAAVNAAAADPHNKRVFLGAGTYTLTGTVAVPAGVTIFGAGFGTHLVGSGAFAAFTLNAGGGQTITGIRFDTFTNSLLGPAANVFAYGNYLVAAPINVNVTGSTTLNI